MDQDDLSKMMMELLRHMTEMYVSEWACWPDDTGKHTSQNHVKLMKLNWANLLLASYLSANKAKMYECSNSLVCLEDYLISACLQLLLF